MADAHAAHELKLYIDNDGDLYRRQTMSILKNLVAKRARGVYNHDSAVKLFGYLTEDGAKKYAREFGSDQPWHKMFDVGTRRRAAEELTREFETEAGLGNYDQLLPKKYQSQKHSGKQAKIRTPERAHARKLQWETLPSVKVVWSPVKQNYLAFWPGKGRIENQDVLKAASAKEMHDWLRDTYGASYGLANRALRPATSPGHARKKRVSSRSGRPPQRGSSVSGRPGVSAQDIRDFRGFLRNASDSQVQGIYDKERSAGRDEYAELALAEAENRGIALDGHYHHARRTSPAQLNREIAAVLGRRRYRS